jgi:hypothetical protein
MVEVFKTNVTTAEIAEQMKAVLSFDFPHFKINFDLHDRDNILRIEGDTICQERIIETLNQRGYECSVLE